MTSCGGSSGGGETEIDFEKSDLVDKYWFANDFVSDNYSQDDDLIVYWFARNGDLIKQEYGGREEKEVGFWDLDEKKLVISDETFGNGEAIDWFLQKGTNLNNLVLSADNRRKLECTTNLSVINDVTTDAFVVNSINSNDDVVRYMQCRVIGKSIEKAKMLLKNGDKFDLVKTIEGTETVFVLGEDDINSLKSESFPDEDDVKFHLSFDKSTDVKLADINDGSIIGSLGTEQDYNQGTHVLKWKAINENNIFYTIEIIDLDGEILFRSNPIFAVANVEMEVIIDKDLDEDFGSIDEIETGKQYEIRVSGLRYEDDVNPTSKHKVYNVQAKTVFAFGIFWS
jgi:hypothetical protein